MFENSNIHLIEKLAEGVKPTTDEWRILLTSLSSDERLFLHDKARSVAVANFGKGIYVRALMEISSYCRNNCYYCGLRCENRNAQRYRLTKDGILECCHEGANLGFNTFVLQGGEDPMQNDSWIADVVAAIRAEYPDKAITLSVGERSEEGYKVFKKAGADRYLLRHETRNDKHYSQLHPPAMSANRRRECLSTLKKLGYQAGSGMMIGSPYQTVDNLVEDFIFLDELQPQMIGVGPFIPADNTPFEYCNAGTLEQTILVVSLLRLRFPHALLPATTALSTIHPQGMEKAILAGANVVMPNISPMGVRGKYTIYNNKMNSGTQSAQQLQLLEDRLNAIGYHINYARGDYEEYK